MKALITSFNSKLGLNPMVARLLHAIPGVEPSSAHDCDVVFLSFIAPECDFVPDKLMLDVISRRRVPVVIFDHTETFPPSYIFPFNELPQESPYKLLESIVQKQMEVKAYFKRELLMAPGLLPGEWGGTFPVYPLDWTLNAIFGDPHIDTREEYNARPIDIFFSWGYSNESRPRLMGELLRQAGKFGAHFCLTADDLNRSLEEKRERIFALLFTPHYRRIHISDLMKWQQRSKVSISMFGAGRKCFRCAEASYNSLMAQQAPNSLQWSYPWEPGDNCIHLPNQATDAAHEIYVSEEIQSVSNLYGALRVNQGSLYDIYLKCVENSKNYRNEQYAREYLLPKLRKALS